MLAGYKQTIDTGDDEIFEYLASLEANSYFTTIYVWDAATSAWDTLDTTNDEVGDADVLSPGMGFWIWMYSDQSLIAPLEPEL